MLLVILLENIDKIECTEHNRMTLQNIIKTLIKSYSDQI